MKCAYGTVPKRALAAYSQVAREQIFQRVTTANLDVAIGGDDEHVHITHFRGEKAEQAQRRFVRPVQIVEHDDERLAKRRVPQEGRHAAEQTKACLLIRPDLDRRRLRHACAELGHQRRHIGGAGRCAAGTLVLVERHARAQHLHPWPKDWRPLHLDAAPNEDGKSAVPGFGSKLLGRARLSDSGLADEQEDAAAGGGGRFQPVAQPLQRARAADEARGCAHRLRRKRGVGSRGPGPTGHRRARPKARPANESIAAAVDGGDHLAPTAYIADATAGGRDAFRQYGLAHRLTAPDGVEQLVLGHHPVTVGQQICEDVEYFRLELDDAAPSAELKQLLVELAVAEHVDHRGTLHGAAHRSRELTNSQPRWGSCR